MRGYVQNHRAERNRQQEKAAPKISAKNAPAHGNLVSVYSFPGGSRYEGCKTRAGVGRDPAAAPILVSQAPARSAMAEDARSVLYLGGRDHVAANARGS